MLTLLPKKIFRGLLNMMMDFPIAIVKTARGLDILRQEQMIKGE